MSQQTGPGSKWLVTWNKACAQFEEAQAINNPGHKIKLRYSENVRNADDVLAMINTSDRAFNPKESPEGKKLSKVLNACVSPITAMISMFGGMAGAAYPPASQILGAVSFVVNAAKATQAAMAELGSMFEKLGQSTKRLKVLNEVDKFSDEFEEIAVGILVCLLTVLDLAARRKPLPEKEGTFHRMAAGIRNHGKEFCRVLAWTEDSEIQAAVSTLDRLTQEELLMNTALIRQDTTVTRQAVLTVKDLVKSVEDLQRQNLEVTLEISADVKDVKEIGKTTSADVKEIKAAIMVMDMRTREREAAASKAKDSDKKSSRTEMRLPKRLQGLLKPAARENTEIYSKIKYDRTEGTAEWILKDPTIASWTDRKSDSIAVVTAPAGSGKTFAIAKLVEQLLSRYPQESNNSSRVSVAYYFCKERVQNLSSPAVMLRTIAYQIALNDTVYAKHVMDLAENDDELRNADVAMLWMLLFHRFFQDARGTAYVLVDAIDECEASAVQSLWTAMEQYIVRPSGGDEGKLKLLFVLGSEGAATMSATLGSQIIQVVLDEEKGIADLRIVVRTRATAAFTNRMISPALMEDVQATVVRVANGNYLHASLIMDIVAAMSRESSIHQFIADPPLDLNYAVGHTLKRLTKDLDEDERQDFKDILSWVTCAQRFLTVARLDALLTLRGSVPARIVNLESLLRHDYFSLYMLSDAPGTSYRTSAERMTARLMPMELARMEQSAEKSKAAVETAGAVDGIDEDQDTKWQTAFTARRTAMEQVNVRLEHGLVSQYIEKQEREKGAIDLTKGQMRCQVLLNCLDIITWKAKSASEEDLNAGLQYCAVFLPEHMINTLPTDGNPKIHLQIVQGLVRLFRDETAIDRWIETAGSYMTADLLNNNEFLDAVKSWLDAETVSKLDHDERTWVEEALTQPIRCFFHLIAQRHAHMWLTQRVVVEYNFEFINTYLHKLEQPTGTADVTGELTPSTIGGEESTDQDAAGKVSAKPDAEDTAMLVDSINATSAPHEDSSNYTLNAASADRVIEVAQWADMKENAMWHARVGYTLRVAGDGPRSIEHFEKSIELDQSDGVNRAGLARTYNFLRDPTNAIKIMADAVVHLIARASAPDLTAEEQEEADGDVADHCEDLAEYYYQAKERDQAICCYDGLLKNWEHQSPRGQVWDTTIYNVTAYLQILADWKLWNSAADLLDRMIQHPRAKTKDFLDIYRFFLYGDTTLLTVSYHSKRFDLADEFYADAVQCLAEHGNDGETAMMRYNRAFAMLRLQPSRSEPVDLLRRTSGDSEFLDADNGFSGWLGRVKVELARKYMDNILCAREKPRWQDVGRWAHKLAALLRDTDDTDDTDAAAATSKQPFVLTLAAWDRISGRLKHARLHVKEMLTDGVDMLSDDDESNDYWAWTLLNNATLAVGDFERAATAIYMLRLLSVAMEMNVPTTSNDDHEQAVEGAQNTDTTAEVSVLPLRDEFHKPPIAPSNDTSVESNMPDDFACADADSKATESASTDDDVASSLQPVITTKSSWYSCDGPCGENIPDTSTIWRCSYCIADFCAGCHDLIMNHKNEHWGFCNATHEHRDFEGVTVKWPKDMVKLEGEFVPVRRWLDELMKDYEIEKKVSAAEVVVAEEKRDTDKVAIN